MIHDRANHTVHGVGSIGTMQEARGRGILSIAGEKNEWLSLQRVLDRLSYMTSDLYRKRLFDSSRLHGHESSVTNFRT